MVHNKPFTSYENMQTDMPITPVLLSQGFEPLPKSIVKVIRSSPIMHDRPRYADQRAGPPLGQAKLFDHEQGGLLLRFGPQNFFESTAFNAWLSNDKSATICFNRRFSSSSVRIFFKSEASMPAYLAFHL